MSCDQRARFSQSAPGKATKGEPPPVTPAQAILRRMVPDSGPVAPHPAQLRQSSGPPLHLLCQPTSHPLPADGVADVVRLEFCVPDLEQQKKNLEDLNSGHYPTQMIAPGCKR